MWAFRSFGPEQWLVGCQKGLLLLKTSQERLLPYTQYNQFTELAQAHILHIAPDRQGQFWICATTGLYTVDPQKGITARYWSGGKDRFYLPAESYQHFYQDPQGIYWLATANAGLIRWDRRQNQHRQFRRSEGLSNDNIYAVYADGRGHLWMSSDYGLMQFDPTRFTTRSYFVEDGITHNEFNRIAHYQDKTAGCILADSMALPPLTRAISKPRNRPPGYPCALPRFASMTIRWISSSIKRMKWSERIPSPYSPMTARVCWILPCSITPMPKKTCMPISLPVSIRNGPTRRSPPCG
jgi:hypothetical protein